MANCGVYAYYDDGEADERYVGLPFYIGYASWEGRPLTNHGRNKHVANKRRKAEANNCFRVEWLTNELSSEDAFEVEEWLTHFYELRKFGGCLCNARYGGRGGFIAFSSDNHPRGMLGKTMSQESRRKLSNAMSGDKHPLYGKKHSAEHKAKLSKAYSKVMQGEGNPMYGRHHSAETRQKLSDIKKRSSPNARPCLTPAGRFSDAYSAAEANKCSLRSVASRCNNLRSKWTKWYWL